MEYFNTFGGNPVSAEIGLAVLDVIADERLQAHARGDGRAAARRARGCGSHVVATCAGTGSSSASSSSSASAPRRGSKEGLKARGVLISTDGPNDDVLKIKPPLVISADDCDRFLEALCGPLTSGHRRRQRRRASGSRPRACWPRAGTRSTITSTTERIHERAAELGARGVVADLTSLGGRRSALVAEAGRLDVLVNNAGMVQTGVDGAGPAVHRADRGRVGARDRPQPAHDVPALPARRAGDGRGRADRQRLVGHRPVRRAAVLGRLRRGEGGRRRADARAGAGARARAA